MYLTDFFSARSRHDSNLQRVLASMPFQSISFPFGSTPYGNGRLRSYLPFRGKGLANPLLTNSLRFQYIILSNNAATKNPILPITINILHIITIGNNTIFANGSNFKDGSIIVFPISRYTFSSFYSL